MKLEDFVPTNLTRRMCTSVPARLYDITQKLAPLHLRLKHDLRKLIKINPSWDAQISAELRQRWIENFQLIEDVRDILYIRCPITEDALRPTVRIWLKCDAADGGMIIVAYFGHERQNGKWSCYHLFSKNLLAPEDWSIPKLELHALSVLATIAWILKQTLGDWIEIIISCSDSEIAICWSMYDNCKMHVFHRLRVSNIRNKLDLSSLYHIDGLENLADTGTRPDLLTAEKLSAGSEWINGKSWMKEPLETVIDMKILKPAKDIILDNEKKKAFKEGMIYDSLECATTNHIVCGIDCRKIVETENFSNYIYPPLKRSFPSFVRIIAIILTATRKFKKLLLKARMKRGEIEKEAVKSIDFGPVKFQSFNSFWTEHSLMTAQNSIESKLEIYPQSVLNKTDCFVATSLDVNEAVTSKENPVFKLSTEAISAALEYCYKKATEEVKLYCDKKTIQKIGVEIEGILYCNSRIHESQELRVAGELEHFIDLKTFAGVSFLVPLIHHNSPLAVSIANHLHYRTYKHRGPESVYRLSLNHVKIINGRTLFNEISNRCEFCKKLRKVYMKQIMGCLSDFQLTISPVFYYTYVDAWGPVKGYTPGFEKSTRTSKKTFDLYIVVFACAATGTINVQVMEGGKDTGCVLEVFNRFFN